MNFQKIWKKSKKMLALLLAVALFFGGWGNYDFSVFASGELTVKLDAENEVYTGSEISLPGIQSVTDGNADVTSYTSTWTDSNGNEVSGNVTEAGSYTLTVKEIETETGEDPETGDPTEETRETGRDGKATFTVEKLNFAECTVTADAATYTGAAITPTNVRVMNKNNAEVKASFYTVQYSNHVEAGDAVITVTAAAGNGNLVEGSSKTGTFKINPIDLSGCTVSLDLTDNKVTYNGTEIKPAVTVASGSSVVNHTFYKVNYADNLNVGTAKVTVEPADANGNVIGRKEVTFTIEARIITENMIVITPDNETVTGDNFKDSVQVIVKDIINGSETSLVEGTDYEFELPDNMVEGGDYTIIISGIGNYSGPVEANFALSYAGDGTAKLEGSTLADQVYANTVTVRPAEGYTIAESVTGQFTDSISYGATPNDYVVYIKNAEGKITEFTLPEFTVDSDIPVLSLTAPAVDSDWAPSKEVKVIATGADYGVFYTTTKQELGSLITQAPSGMTRLQGDTLTITDNLSAETSYYFYAIDKAGHVVTAETVVNKIDTELPEISYSGNDDRLIGDVYWKSTEDLVFEVNMKDQENLSGLKEIVVEAAITDGIDCEFTEGDLEAGGTFTISEAGNYILKVVDVAGNESETEIIVKQDTKAPEVVLEEPTGENKFKKNDEYWFSSKDVMIPLNITDDNGADEADKAPYTVIYAADENFTNPSEAEISEDQANISVVLSPGSAGKTTYYFKVTDKAGNVGQVQSVTVAYDDGKPEITSVELTQLNGDEWINLSESGAAQSNGTNVAFAVSAADSETGIQKIQYRSNHNDSWKDAVITESNGTYTFVTNETYADGKEYAWAVRVVNNVEKASEQSVEGGQIDTVAPSTTAYIRLLSDTAGANDINRGTVTDGKWTSNIYKMAEEAWNKVWGRETVKYEVYVQDVTSGFGSITMSYNGSDVGTLHKVEGLQAFTTGEGETKEGYCVFEGEITYTGDEGLRVRDFRIDSLTDKAGNTVNEQVVLGNAADTDIIYLDNVAPELTSVKIGETDVVTDRIYFYESSQELVLTINERFFAEEKNADGTSVYPNVVLYSRESGISDFTPVDDAVIEWTTDDTGTVGTGTVSLPAVDDTEIEYQVTMIYADPSGNALANNGRLGVEDGVFTSKIFAIDNVAPNLDSFSVKGTGCYVDEASVLENSTEADDLIVEFTIDDNPEYYAKTDEHAYSQNNLAVYLYKENELIKTFQDGVEGSDPLTTTVDGRKHTYQFSYDGEVDTQDKFYVEVEYTDVLNRQMTGEGIIDGVYTSEKYIIDHAAPVFDITYSEATNVIKDGKNAEGTAPLATHVAYYNKNISVTMTFDEKYYNISDNNELEHFNIKLTKDGKDISTPEITWNHADSVHTAAFTINAAPDHSSDGDYQFEVEYRDCAVNWMDTTGVKASDENPEDDGIYTSPMLILDTTAPVVTTSYAQEANQTLDERDYFNSDTTFIVEVADRSIRYKELKDALSGMTAVDVDGDAISDTQLAEDIAKIEANVVMHANGSKDPAVWSVPLTLSTEANYDIPISYTDLAGNAATVECKILDPSGNYVITSYGTDYVEKVTIDKQLLAENIYIKFIGDVKGTAVLENILEDTTTEEGNWISKIFGFIADQWHKLWGEKEIKFEVYLRDEISGIHEITMQYTDEKGKTVPCKLDKKNDVKLLVNEEGAASIDETGENYVVYSGSIVIGEDTDIAVSQFQIAKVTDKSLNALKEVMFTSKGDAEILYLDDKAPELVSVTFNGQPAVDEEKYFHNEASEVRLTIEERFFGQEDMARYPSYTLKIKDVTASTDSESVEETIQVVETAGQWSREEGTNKYTLPIQLPLVQGAELECQIELTYSDASGNPLVNGGSVNGVDEETGKFTSKIFVVDCAAPVLTAVTIDDVAVDASDRYFYSEEKEVKLTIEERYFGKETNPVYPSYVVTTRNVVDPEKMIVETGQPVETAGKWTREEDTNKYTLPITLPKGENVELEYQIELAYFDASGNPLVNGKGIEGVDEETGKFTSKLFAIDTLAPELVSYSVETTECDVNGASVLKNNTETDDLVVNFTFNDNPTYYKKVVKEGEASKEVNHETSQDNLIVQLWKNDGVIAKLTTNDDGTLTSGNKLVTCSELSVSGREHSYSFSYDGTTATQDEFHVTVEYKDIVEHKMIDDVDTVTPGVLEDGIYTSEKYIIDHIKPVFDISYSDATNVVEGKRYHTTESVIADGKSPLKGYTAYYNRDIKVTMTFDEKYYNIVDHDDLEHFEIEVTKVTKEEKSTFRPEITWSHVGNMHTAMFTIEALADHSNDGDYQFEVKYSDCAENAMDTGKTADCNETTAAVTYKSPVLVMDTTAPEFTKVSYDTINSFNRVKDRDYVNAPTTMSFTMTEHNPRPTSAYSITTEGEKTAAWTINGDTSTTKLETVPMRNAKGDEQTVSMYVEDWAGNKVVCKDGVLRSEDNTAINAGTFTDRFTVDTVAPEIELEYVQYSPNNPNVEGVDYFKDPITVKITVNEHNFDEDLFKQMVKTKGENLGYKESAEWLHHGDIHVKTFTFTADNQYDLSINGTDNAKNRLVLNDASDMTESLDAESSTVSVSVAVDSTIPAIGDNVKPIIVIEPVEPQNDTIDGMALYNKDVTYRVVVYDPLVNAYASGINDVTFKVTGENGSAATCTVNKAGQINNQGGVTVTRKSGDVAELARGKDNKYIFHVTISSTEFNTNDVLLWVAANDVATRHNEEEAEPIAIDITKPEVLVSYDNNDVSNEKYFHDVRTATVRVKERNFSDDCLQFIVNGEDKKLNFSLVEEGNGNRDDAIWVAHYTFSPDQDYTVNVKVQDRAKNEGTVSYEGMAPQEFTIDMIKPKISVKYDNNDVLNELYYKEARTATITIEEHNFSAEDVEIQLTAKDGGAVINTPGVSSWTSDGDYHRATIRYDYDGEFTFDIEFMDLATNEADDYKMDHFIVDLTVPELEIFDIEHMSANNGIVRPGVRYSDTNYDPDGTVVVMTGYHNGVIEMTGSRRITATGVEFKLDDFKHEKSIDDIYTMHATVYDLAGNSSEATVMFSVNRFGSVYTFDKETEALIGDNGKYYTNKEQQLVITETNVDTLEFKEITLNLNGKLRTLKEGVDFTVSLDGNESTWKQYTYKIGEENFVEEGTYILTIYSEDRATNTSDNNSKGKNVEFVVDKTNPSLLLSGIENTGQYRTSNKEVIIDVEDNVRLSKVVVKVDEEELAVFDAAAIDEANGRLTVSISDSSDWQVIDVTAYDAAGNVYSYDQMRVLVSANIFVQWYRNTPIFYGSIGGTLGICALLWWFLIGKKKKKEDETQQTK